MSDSGLAWRKAAASTANGNCVEIAPFNGGIAMRDSKDPAGPVLHFGREGFEVFIDWMKAGALDNATGGTK